MPDAGEKVWFGAGVEASLDSLYGLALRLTRSSADADDLVAETVAKAWSALATLEDRSRLRPWLFRILHNCYISDYRKKAVRPVQYGYDELVPEGNEDELTAYLIRQNDSFLSWWGSPEQEFANRLLGEDILAAIEKLPEAFRIVVLLVNVEGLSYDEAAGVLGVPPGTIRSRMKRGRTMLQKALWDHASEAGLIHEVHMKGCKL